jgi:small multidrug resistance family-3 protein
VPLSVSAADRRLLSADAQNPSTRVRRRNIDRGNPEASERVDLENVCAFVLTALAEILGCYLPYVWLRRSGSPWLLVPAAASLAIFSWLLTLHPAAAGRVYAAYGGVQVALAWLWKVDDVPLIRWDLTGAVALLGMGIIVWGGFRA